MSRLKTDAIRNVNASVDGITLDTSGNVAIPNELQLADKIVHTGDTNTAIRFLANDTVSVETGAAERFRITSDGSVMFGSGVPSEDLHLKKARANFLVEGTNDTVGGNVANINVRAPYYRRAGYSISDTGGNEDFWIGRPYGEGDSNAAVAINMGGAEKLRLFHSGDFCINRNSGLSNAKVSIQCDAGEAGIAVQLNASSGTSNLIQAYSSAGPNVASICVDPDASPDLLFKLYDGSNTVERLRITSAGKVLIGTTTVGHANADDLTIGSTTAGSRGGLTINAANDKDCSIHFGDNNSNLSGQINYDHNGDFLSFYTGGTKRARFDSDGLKFNLDTSNSNSLDDYEEGSWTPVIKGSTSAGTATYTSRSGHYVKIGRIVQIFSDVRWSSHNGSGGLEVHGLPYALNNGGYTGEFGVNYNSGMSYATDVHYGWANNGGSYIRYWETNSSGGSGSLALDSSVSEVHFYGTYISAS